MQPDVVLYGHLLLLPLAWVARRLSPRSRNLLIVHGWEVWIEPFRTRVPRWERLAVRSWIDQVVSVSRFTAERMKAAYGLPDSFFRLLPNAVDLPLSPPPRQSGHRNGLRLLTVTRLHLQDRYKGCDKVIRALPRILAEVPNARYDLVGEGPLRPELERLAVEIGVRDSIRFHGYVDDQALARIYKEAHLLVMPSTGEGFGIVFLEAWKHGLPVVVGDQDASSEVVTDGVNGFCVDPGSVDEIAQAVLALLKDRDKAGRMGREGYQTILRCYGHEHFRQALWRVLQAQPAHS
jgi:glycosyltransferase involved in cell wall biosynthesis